MAFLRFKRWVYAVWGKALANAMTPGEWRRFWELRRQFGVVPTPGGSFAERAPPAPWSAGVRRRVFVALAELRWDRVAEAERAAEAASGAASDWLSRQLALRVA
jgi:hypothetical protein